MASKWMDFWQRRGAYPVLCARKAADTTTTMDEKTVRHVANLARLTLAEGEVARFAADLTSITDYISQLAKADTDGVEMTVHPGAIRNVWREDEQQPSLRRDEAVANAPDSEQNFFKVPPVIE